MCNPIIYPASYRPDWIMAAASFHLSRPRPAIFRKPCGVLSSKWGCPFPYLRTYPWNTTWLTFVSRKNNISAAVASPFSKSVVTWGPLGASTGRPCRISPTWLSTVEPMPGGDGGLVSHCHTTSTYLTEFCRACRRLLSPHDQQL